MKNSITLRLVGAAGLLGASALALVFVKAPPTTAASITPPVAPLARAVVMYDPPVYVAADARHSSRYSGYEITEYRPTKHLITAIRPGGQRDRTILVETNGTTWVELDVSTESNTGNFRMEIEDESSAEFKVNQVLASTAAPDASGDWSAVCVDDDQVLVSKDALEVLMDVATDENLNAEVEVLGPFATIGVPCCGGGGQQMMAGLCFRPAWWPPEVKFVNCSGCGICVIPPEEDGTPTNCNPGDGTWYPTDGITAPGYGLGQWYKIPDNCTVTINCIACVPQFSCCCNLAAIIAVACGYDACVAKCTMMDCCANPNDPCHKHNNIPCGACP